MAGPARGISVSNITGGNHLGTVVDISMNCAASTGNNCQGTTTGNINVQAVYLSAATTTFMDNISSSTAATEATLGTYSLGDGTGSVSAGPNTRPILTTSSSLGSRPNLIGMATATPITGVQGTTGTLVQMSTGSAPNGDLLKFDGNGNAIDSSLPAANIASTVPFFNSTSVAGSTTAVLANTTIKLWGFSLPNAVTTTALTFFVSATDGTNSYSFGVYNTSGTLLLNVGPSTSLVNAASSKTVSWTSGSGTTLVPGKYYFATATTCAATCATLSGSVTGSFAVNVGAGTATGANLSNPNTNFPITDAYAIGATPSFTIH
jgi:hypothetical protein